MDSKLWDARFQHLKETIDNLNFDEALTFREVEYIETAAAALVRLAEDSWIEYLDHSLENRLQIALWALPSDPDALDEQLEELPAIELSEEDE